MEGLLKARGIRVWRDEHSLSDGNSLESGITEGLDHSVGMVTFWTKHSIDSDGVKMEWDKGERKSRKNPNFLQIPLFFDISITEVSDCTGIVFNKKGRVYDENQNSIDEFLRETANKITERFSDYILSDNPIRVGIYSKVKAPKNNEEDFSFDFYELLEEKGEKNPETWELIQQAMEDFYQIISYQAKSKVIHVTSKCHLSVSLLFGNLFNQKSGFHFLIDKDGEQWDVKSLPDQSVGLDCVELQSDMYNKENALVAIHCGQPVETDLPLGDIKHRVCSIYSPIDQTTREPITTLDNPETVKVALNLREKCIELRKEYGKINTLHLFVAGPKELAFTVGFYLTSAGPFQIYDFDYKIRLYYPTVRLS